MADNFFFLDALKGKVIWITGASSGIGKHLAYHCAKHGSKVVLSARRENELQEVKKKCIGTFIQMYCTVSLNVFKYL